MFFFLVNCRPGYFFNNTGCQACAEDQYQDQKSQISCVSCPSGTSTFGQVASKGRKDCRSQLKWSLCFVCLFVRFLSNYICGLVEQIVFLNQKGLYKYCLQSNYNCTFYILYIFFSANCTFGSFFNNTGCQACAEDHYQDQEAQTSCVPCPSGTSTFGHMASKRREDCRGQW